MTTYAGDSQDELRDCFTSLFEQEQQPDETIIIQGRDLPSELVEVITEFEMRAPFCVHDIATDEQGRGHARKIGVETAASKFIVVIETDDIICSNRLYRQLEYFDENLSTDVVGEYIGEFETEPNEMASVREVRTELEEIKRIARCPCSINHPTVMFRRDTVLDVRNYPDREYGQDYELWCRLLTSGKGVTDVPEILVKIRATKLITPVATSDQSSLLEVVNNTQVVVDYIKPNAIASRVGRVLRDEVFATRRRERGLERATQFSWGETASTIDNTVGKVSEN
jgi:glycosyltransferase involved in cell wall biosynthesis